MKRSLRILVFSMLVIGISLSLFAAGTKEAAQDGPKVINLWSFTDEVPKMLERYKELHPDFDYDIKSTIIATTDGAY
ncbi:MAG TPA: carbohydrate ABC transporter substrate-binding protein, partial [Sphaerochaeta sp.]|nr:carbohydrate ABC transporter substrate-binding protein [Sphaerochaeta sp.]